MFLNYPNNPIGASADRSFFKKLIDFANDYNIIVMHDNPYSEIYYDGERSLSLLEMEGAKDVAVEFHSLSKTYNMTGWRIGSVVGNADVVAGIGKIKSNIDSGTFGAVQDAGIVALQSPKEVVDEIRKIYQHRIEILYQALQGSGAGAGEAAGHALPLGLGGRKLHRVRSEAPGEDGHRGHARCGLWKVRRGLHQVLHHPADGEDRRGCGAAGEDGH